MSIVVSHIIHLVVGSASTRLKIAFLNQVDNVSTNILFTG